MITAHQALNQWTSEEKSSYARADAAIDAALTPYTGRAEVDLSPFGCSQRVLLALFAEAKKGDWTLRALGDNRFEFTTPGKTPCPAT